MAALHSAYVKPVRRESALMSRPESIILLPLRLGHDLQPLRLRAFVLDPEITRHRVGADIERMTFAVFAIGQDAEFVGGAVELRLVVDDDSRAGLLGERSLPVHRGQILIEMR